MDQNLPAIMILGVYHMANNNLDLIKTDYDDHLSTKRRAEIEEVLDRLVAYRPTHIAIEQDVDKQTSIDNDYQDYLQGKFELTANEKHLIGFQLAQRLDQQKLYCVDRNEAPDPVKMYIGQILPFGEDQGQTYITDHLDTYNQQRMTQQWQSLSVREHLIQLNTKENYERDHQFYISAAAIGNQPTVNQGADWVGMYWYTRNLRIYANLSHIAYRQPDSRILMIVGAAHVKLLNEFVGDAHHLQLILAIDYLK